jgi:hypothetical protein
MADQVLVTDRVTRLARRGYFTNQAEVQYSIVKKRGAPVRNLVSASRVFEFLRRP